MQNLLTETLNVLKSNGKTPEDVIFIGDGKYHTDWNGFEKVANIEYDNGYGGNEVSLSIKVVGDGWWLERWGYDGSEGWWYREKILKGEKKVLFSVFNYNCYNKVTWGEV